MSMSQNSPFELCGAVRARCALTRPQGFATFGAALFSAVAPNVSKVVRIYFETLTECFPALLLMG